jgi:hypothetical protein
VWKTCDECHQPFETNRSSRRYCPGYSCSNKANARTRETAKLSGDAATVWSCGGGVQSTAIALMIVQGRLPKPDFALITDCGWEKQATFEYVNSVTMPRLAEVGVQLNVVKTTDYGENSIFDASGCVRMPCYKRAGDGEVIRFDTHCSGRWKTAVAKRWMREQGIARAANWIGISADESHRVHLSSLKWLEYRYPLVDLGISRQDCLDMIGEAGWPRPPRTSCYFCPQQDNRSWQRTKRDYPEDWLRAIETEQAIQEREPDVYLHRSLVPLPEVEFTIDWADIVHECEAPGVACWA